MIIFHKLFCAIFLFFVSLSLIKPGEMNYKKILCAAPRLEVIQSWKNDLEKWKFDVDIEYVTHTSIEKFKDWKGDLFILD